MCSTSLENITYNIILYVFIFPICLCQRSRSISQFITYLVQIKAFLYDQYDRKQTVHIFTPRENNRLLDYYKIISISRPILAWANMGLDFVSGQYGCLFSRCRKYVINSLIHGHFHIGLVIIPRSILDLGMITRPIWKYPCINLYILTGQYLSILTA